MATQSLACHNTSVFATDWSFTEKLDKLIEPPIPKYATSGTKVNPMLIFKKLQQGSDLGVVQTLVHESLNVKEEDTLRVINDARAYMMQIDTANKLPKELRDLCKNVHEYCTLWAVLGECDANPLCKEKKYVPSLRYWAWGGGSECAPPPRSRSLSCLCFPWIRSDCLIAFIFPVCLDCPPNK